MKKCNLIWLFLAVTLLAPAFAIAQTPGNKGGTIGPGDPPPGTPLIIVDKVIINQQNPCTVPELSPRGIGSVNKFCLNKAGQGEEGYTNTYNAEVEKGESGLRFTMMYGNLPGYGNDLFIGNVKKIGQGNLRLKFVNDTQVDCVNVIDVINNIEELVFSINSTVNSLYQAKVEITFYNSCYYGGCGSVLCEIIPVKHPDGRDSMRSIVNEPHLLVSPNPFSQETRFNYSLENPQPVSIQVFNAQGTLVQTLVQEQLQDAGDYTAILDGTQLANGVYFAVVQVGATRKIHSLVKSN